MDLIELTHPERKVHLGSALHSVPDLMIRLALTPAEIKKLKRDRTTCMIIEAPSAEWVEPLAKAAKLLGDWQSVHSTKEPVRKSYRSVIPNDKAVHTLAAGGRTLGVSQNPFSYLPKAMTASADILLKIAAPDDEILREAIKLATGSTPHLIPQGISTGLDYGRDLRRDTFRQHGQVLYRTPPCGVSS